MKSTTIFFLWLGCFCLPAFALSQKNIPASPNAFDSDGNKHGAWTYTYSSDWEITEDLDSIAYYRLIAYEHGVLK